MADAIIGNIILEGATTVEDVLVSKEANKRVIAEGTLQDLDVENRNHRIYSKKDIAPEINGPRMKELIEAKQFKGEMGHPLSDSIVRQQTIDPKLTCVNYLKVWIDGNRIKAQFKGTNNEYGEYFDQDLREGCKPAFSLRALGSIENVGGKAYVRGVKVITFDEVIYPSHRTAYMERVVSESAIETKSGLVNENQIIVPYDDPGKIIKITGSMAQDTLNKLQRESANIGAILETFEGIADKVSLINNASQVLLTNRFGDRFTINLENYVQNLIMDYVCG